MVTTIRCSCGQPLLTYNDNVYSSIRAVPPCPVCLANSLEKATLKKIERIAMNVVSGTTRTDVAQAILDYHDLLRKKK